MSLSSLIHSFKESKMMSLPLRVKTLIKELDLLPHPEGGYYRETYRSSVLVEGERSVSTMIYFLLTSDDRSSFHRIDTDEGWHHYEGDTIRIHILDQDDHRWVDVGRFEKEVTPQALIPAGLWFGAEVLPGSHGYALVGCTVAPGFEFSHFQLAEKDELMMKTPEHKSIIEQLT